MDRKSLCRWCVAGILSLIGTGAAAQAESLTTNFSNGFSNEGIMFDIVASHAMEVTGFQVGLIRPEPFNVRLYTRVGTFVGSERDPDAWMLAGEQTLTGVPHAGPSSLFTLDSPLFLSAGERRGIYIVQTPAAKGVSFSAGTGPGTMAAADDWLSIFVGSSMNGLFGVIGSMDRTPNVTLYYQLAEVARPEVRLFGRRNRRSSANGMRVRGRASSEIGIRAVQIRFQQLRADGSKRTISRRLEVSARGIFRQRVPVLAGRTNRVRVQAIDERGGRSATVRRLIFGRRAG